ncbi:MAG: DegT/DnrJ/EryC1/StrS family aminotransferase [bacterium]
MFDPTLPQEVQDAVEATTLRVLRSGQYILGAEVSRFEERFADFVGASHAVGTSSGTDALLMALMALGVGPGDEVVVPDFTFFSPAGCVARLGATPVFVDVDTFYGLDPEQLQRALSPNTKAVIAVHLFGHLCAIEPIAAICTAADVALIEDCAQAVGVRDAAGRHAGSWGAMACYSFFPTKNLGAAGDGGAVTTTDGDLAHQLRLLRTHGAQPKYVHQVVGGNFRLDALQAAILAAKLPFLEGWNQARRGNAAYYDTHLPVVARTRGASTFHQYVIDVPKRDEFCAYLRTQGIETAIYYPMSMCDQPCFVGRAHKACQARSFAHNVVALPVHPRLTPADLVHVSEAVGHWFVQNPS